MKRSFNPASVPQAIALESVQVASPCHADWEAMHGDDRSRFCPSCAKNVYNLSAMTRGEAELLLQEKEGRLCVRYFMREDGTMLTQDCPIGAAALKERSPSFALWAGVASVMAFVGAFMSPAFMSGASAQPELPADVTPVPAATISVPEMPARMGGIAIPVATPQPHVFETKGEVRVAAPQPTCEPIMGKPALPKATPISQPQKLTHTLGRIAMPKAVPTPTPAPKATPTPAPTVAPAPNVPPPMMGLVALAPPKAKTPPTAKQKMPPKSKQK